MSNAEEAILGLTGVALTLFAMSSRFARDRTVLAKEEWHFLGEG